MSEYDDNLDRAAEVVAYLEDEGMDFTYDGNFLADADSDNYIVSVQEDGSLTITPKMDLDKAVAEILGVDSSDVINGAEQQEYTFRYDMDSDSDLRAVINIYESSKRFMD